jgi:3'-5' exonuclease
MLHRISAPGLEGRPYFKQYTDDATDLCDVLSSFDSRSKMKLNDLCRALNLPGKPDGIDGSQVEQLFAEGRIAEVADYCECDVMSTYRLWLLHEPFKGAISAEEHERSELALSDFIVARIQDKPHWARLRAIDHIVPMHCTGEPFYEILKAELPKKVIRSYTGTKLVFGA